MLVAHHRAAIDSLREPTEQDLTATMIEGAQAMLAFAQQAGAELAILTDMSAACGSQVISDGCRLLAERRWQKGVGVATAMLLDASIPVVPQRTTERSRCYEHASNQAFCPPTTCETTMSTRGCWRTSRECIHG